MKKMFLVAIMLVSVFTIQAQESKYTTFDADNYDLTNKQEMKECYQDTYNLNDAMKRNQVVVKVSYENDAMLLSFDTDNEKIDPDNLDIARTLCESFMTNIGFSGWTILQGHGVDYVKVETRYKGEYVDFFTMDVYLLLQ